MKYISYGIDGLWHEWTDFKEMLEYYKGHPKDRWTWFIEKESK
jgi:hypothetical protein